MSQMASDGREQMQIQFTVDQQNQLLHLAREAISNHVKRQQPPAPSPLLSTLTQQMGVFVTVRCNTPQGLQLRGCIGQVETDLPLYQAVPQMAVKAASTDPRFPPITPDELNTLHISISILSKVKPLPQPETFKLGVHGLLIEGHGRRGLLLPEVPLNHHWTKQEFLEALCRKASLPPDAWRSNQVKLFAFITLEFEET